MKTNEIKKIIVKSTKDFCIKQILDCGQIFRYYLLNDKTAVVVSCDKIAVVYESDKSAEILTENIDYFQNYFDMLTDYSKIKLELEKDKFLKPCCENCYGVRILKQNFFEMLISFMISANNSIVRIKKSVNFLSKKFGKKCEITIDKFPDIETDLFASDDGTITYYAFPTLQELKTATVQDFVYAGLGYRAEQMYETIQRLNENDLIEFKKKSSSEKYKWLLTLKGVGEKVANCIMLFSESDMSSFPVDTWINKVYNDITKTESKNRKEIETELKNRYKNLSGYAQQYFFYYYRTFKNK